MTLAVDPVAVTVEAPPGAAPAPRSEAAPRRWRWLPALLLVACAILYVIGERSIPYAVPSEWGLIGATSPAYPVSIALAVLAFAVSVRQKSIRAATASTLALILVLRLPRLTATDMPMYAWAFKHLGVVDYIQHEQVLARGVDIYAGWPGAFATTAWFCDVTGLSPTTFAHWFIPCFHLFLAVMVFGVARAWGLPPLTALTAAFLVAALDWVEQDYFSPQAFALLLAAGIMTLVGLSRNRPTGVWLMIVLFAALNLTHQLTPYWVVLVIGLLVVTRNFKPWWILIPMVLLIVTQLLYNWDEVSRFSLFSGDLFKNTQSNIGRFHLTPVFGQRVVSIGNKVLAGGLWLAVLLTLLVRWRRRQPFVAVGILALSGMMILGGQSYGGEAIFRVYLYCLIGCCVVLAPVLVAALQARLRTCVATVPVLLLAVGQSVMGNTGSWYANVMPKVQFETARAVLNQAELPAYLTIVAPVWPERSTWRYVDYARFNKSFDAPMIYSASLARRHFDNEGDYAEFMTKVNARQDASTYLIFTDQMRIYTWYFGILPWDALPNLKERIRNDPANWTPFYDGQGISVFVHRVGVNEAVWADPEPAPLDGGVPPPVGTPVPPVAEAPVVETGAGYVEPSPVEVAPVEPVPPGGS